MITQESLDRFVEELFPNIEIAQFSTDWIVNSPRATEDSARKVYGFLMDKGLKNDKIASHAHLLGMNPETIERNYQRLSALGLKDDKIASHAHLLGMNPETIERNYQRLSALGLKDDKIASQAHLLGRDPETIERNYQRLSALGLKNDKIASRAELLGRDPEIIERNYQRLSALGLKNDKIASRAELLGMNPETIERNNQHHVGLLRENYQDRASGRDLLTNQAQLLGISPETTNANVQFLYGLGIDYHDAFLLGSTPQLKRNKMAWMLRELFNYRNLTQEKRRYAIAGLYDFVRNDPRVLTKSISSMEKAKDKLRKGVVQYKA